MVGGVVGTDVPAGNDTTPVATTTYLAEVIVGHTCLVTGIAVKNGSVAGTDKLCVALLDVNGNVLAQSDPAGVTASGTSAYQRLPFLTPGAIQIRPGVYYVAQQANGTTTRLCTFHVGSFGTGSILSGTFGVFVAAAPPVTFTADKGPMAQLY